MPLRSRSAASPSTRPRCSSFPSRWRRRRTRAPARPRGTAAGDRCSPRGPRDRARSGCGSRRAPGCGCLATPGRLALGRGRRVLEALVEQRSVELGQLEPEASERLAELLPLAFPEVARERPEAWPRRPAVQLANTLRTKLTSRAMSGGGAGWRLEREPPVVSDLGESARALREVDTARSRTAVARTNARVLDVNPPDQRAKRPDLRGDVEAALRERVREVEVAPERVRVPRGRRARGSPRRRAFPRSRA